MGLNVDSDSAWSKEHRSYTERPSDPEGKIITISKAYRYDDADDTGSDEDDGQWATVNQVTMYPGAAEYNSDYNNYKLAVNHDWTAYGSADRDQNVKRVKPSEDKDTEVHTTYNVGYQTAGVSYSFDMPDIALTVNWNSDQYNATWDWSQGTAPGDKSRYFNNGSRIVSQERLYDSDQDGVCEVNIDATFDYQNDWGTPSEPDISVTQGLIY